MAERNTTAPLDLPPPGVDAMEFYMQRARTLAAARASLARAPAPNPASKSLSFDDRLKLERAIAKSEKLTSDAQAQLERPVLAPFELTPLEQVEEDNAKAKQYSESLTKKLHDHKLTQIQTLHVSVMATIERIEAKQLLPSRPQTSRTPRPITASTLAPEPQARTSRIPRLADLEACAPAYQSGKTFFERLNKTD
ncbi:hypothetical protein Slin14017_G100930 [Septoria linicola]|nr:hypothetical protein Slin14017_G100930 [Septoria linicola]